jgi:hypothetical protein
MRRSYRLEPANGIGPVLEFEWDPGTGELFGPAAQGIRATVEDAQRAGRVMGLPIPTLYEISDPLRTPSEMAVILGTLWRLPPDLAAAYPKPPSENDVPPAASS